MIVPFLQQQVQQEQTNNVLKFVQGFEGHLVTLGVLLLIMSSLSFYYFNSLKKANSYTDLPKIPFLIFSAVQWVSRNSEQILGKNFEKALPFFIYIISYFWFSNILSIMGFKPLGSSLVVPASLGILIFIVTIGIGLYYRRAYFFDDYLFWIRFRGRKIAPIPDILKLIGEISRVISLTCRLWGNTLAGSLILFLIYEGAHTLFEKGSVQFLGPVLIPLFVFPLHIYFDVLDGTIQPMIFMLLGMSYWAIATSAENKELDQKRLKLENKEA